MFVEKLSKSIQLLLFVTHVLFPQSNFPKTSISDCIFVTNRTVIALARLRHSLNVCISHADAHNVESGIPTHWCWRSTAFVKCTASEQSENRLPSISEIIYYLDFTQTVTTLDLQQNNISDEGAQHLGSALQVNRVRLVFPLFQK